MGTAVHVDGFVDGPEPLQVPGRHLPRHRVHFLRDAQLRRSTRDVRHGMGAALPLGQRLDRGDPGHGAQPRRLVHGNTDPVAQLGISGVVFLADRRPLAGEIDATRRRIHVLLLRVAAQAAGAEQRRRQHTCGGQRAWNVVHTKPLQLESDLPRRTRRSNPGLPLSIVRQAQVVTSSIEG